MKKLYELIGKITVIIIATGLLYLGLKLIGDEPPITTTEEAIQRSKNAVYEAQYQNERTERLNELERSY